MKEFMLLVRMPITYSSEQAKAVNPEWDLILQQWKTNNVFVTSFVFPGESYVLSGAGKWAKKEAVLSDNRRMVSSIILLASSLENAVALAKECPILKYDGTVEVREIPPRI